MVWANVQGAQGRGPWQGLPRLRTAARASRRDDEAVRGMVALGLASALIAFLAVVGVIALVRVLL